MKKKILEEIYSKSFDGRFRDVRFSDLPKDLKADDVIDIHREEAHYSENESHGEYTELVVFREREETDEEYQKRLEKNKWVQEDLKKRRYESYLRLKAEFETTPKSVLPSTGLTEGKERGNTKVVTTPKPKIIPAPQSTRKKT